jgi:hypothetical protein
MDGVHPVDIGSAQKRADLPLRMAFKDLAMQVSVSSLLEVSFPPVTIAE